MQIEKKYVNGLTCIEISSDEKTTAVLLEASPTVVKSSSQSVVYKKITAKPEKLKDKDNRLHITTAGEYEKDGIFLTAIAAKNRESLDLIEIEVENIRVLVYLADEVIEREVLKSLGVIDIMILPVTNPEMAVSQMLGVIDPRVLLMTDIKAGAAEKFATTAAINFEKTKKYKCKQSDFSGEEFLLEGIILEN